MREYTVHVKILVLVAGTNDPSNADCLADYFSEGLKCVAGTEVEKIRLKDLSIEHFHLEHYNAATDQGEDFRKIQTLVTDADGVVIATPIWNFSIPAHLKNLIDRMGSFGLDAESHSLGMLKGKPFYLLFTGGSPAIVWTGLQKKTTSHLPTSIGYFGGAVLGSHYEERCTRGRGQFGCVVNTRKGTEEGVSAKGQRFAIVVEQFSKTGRLPLKHRIKMGIVRVGQQIKKKLGL